MASGHDAFAAYGQYARPGVARLLNAFGLDVVFHRAAGDYLYTYSLDAHGRETPILDLVGGFGAALFGHHHPALVEVMRGALDRGTTFNAQASVRAQAGALAERLATTVTASTGRDYVVTFGSTGADAVEASMKHAVAAQTKRLTRLQDDLERAARRVRRDGIAQMELTGQGGDAPLSRILEDALATVARVREDNPVFITLSGAFHGKTAGAATLTDSTARAGDVSLHGLRRHRITSWDPADFLTTFDQERTLVPMISFDRAGRPQILTVTVSTVAACYAEPIQGEGGVREVPTATLRGLRALADRHGALLVFDEIQCGMGRTGTFLASTSSGVRADHYLLAKSLGGGLVKVAAALIDRKHYVDDVGRYHTSTFADDDLSATVSLAALDLLPSLLPRINSRGQRLIEDLGALTRRWPHVFGEVRGRGLLLGVDLLPPQFGSAVVREALGVDALGYTVAGYLLHRHHVRVLPTLSAPCTLRIEPSAFLDDMAQRRLLDALTDYAEVLTRRNAATLLGHLGQTASGPWPEPCQPRPARRYDFEAATGTPRRTRVAFLANFEGPQTLRSVAPELSSWSDAQCSALLDRLLGEVEPFEVATRVITSPHAGEIELDVIGVPFTAAQANLLMRQGRRDWLRNQVLDAVERAIGRGASVIGLGGYTSIVTDSARDVVEDTVRVTSGNALTAACALDAVQGWTITGGPIRQIGIVGALGNIGAILAEQLADHAETLTLVGRPGSARRLQHTASTLAGTARVTVSEDLNALRDCDAVVTVSNAPEPVIMPQHLRSDTPVLLYDIAVPGDVAPVVANQPNVQWRHGSRMKLPQSQHVHIPGAGLPPGIVHACLAEALLLGFESSAATASQGMLTSAGVRTIRHHAARHGFVLADEQMERSA